MKRRLLEIDQALTVASLIHVNLFEPPSKALKGEGWGKEKGEGIGERKEGLPLPFPFRAFLPTPPLTPAFFAPARQFNLF